jgi:hypothetical protein
MHAREGDGSVSGGQEAREDDLGPLRVRVGARSVEGHRVHREEGEIQPLQKEASGRNEYDARIARPIQSGLEEGRQRKRAEYARGEGSFNPVDGELSVARQNAGIVDEDVDAARGKPGREASDRVEAGKVDGGEVNVLRPALACHDISRFRASGGVAAEHPYVEAASRELEGSCTADAGVCSGDERDSSRLVSRPLGLESSSIHLEANAVERVGGDGVGQGTKKSNDPTERAHVGLDAFGAWRESGFVKSM